MIKSIVKNKNNKSEYPKLMEYIAPSGSGFIILLQCPKVGTVVRAGGNAKIGDFRQDWVMSYFKDFNEELVLSNDRE